MMCVYLMESESALQTSLQVNGLQMELETDDNFTRKNLKEHVTLFELKSIQRRASWKSIDPSIQSSVAPDYRDKCITYSEKVETPTQDKHRGINNHTILDWFGHRFQYLGIEQYSDKHDVKCGRHGSSDAKALMEIELQHSSLNDTMR